MPNGIESLECFFEYSEELKKKHENEWRDFIIKTILDCLENDTMGIRTYFDERYYKYTSLKTSNERYLKI